MDKNGPKIHFLTSKTGNFKSKVDFEGFGEKRDTLWKIENFQKKRGNIEDLLFTVHPRMAYRGQN
jgi:hypothetical protein